MTLFEEKGERVRQRSLRALTNDVCSTRIAWARWLQDLLQVCSCYTTKFDLGLAASSDEGWQLIATH